MSIRTREYRRSKEDTSSCTCISLSLRYDVASVSRFRRPCTDCDTDYRTLAGSGRQFSSDLGVMVRGASGNRGTPLHRAEPFKRRRGVASRDRTGLQRRPKAAVFATRPRSSTTSLCRTCSPILMPSHQLLAASRRSSDQAGA